MDLLTDDFDYDLPSHLIAQEPSSRREGSRLLVLDRRTSSIHHDVFANLPRHLKRGDLLVANRSRVVPARLDATKATGGSVELLLLRAIDDRTWIALARPSRRLRAGLELRVRGSSLVATLLESRGDGEWLVRFTGPDVDVQLREAGRLPLPPYITNPRAPLDRYQTVFADRDGSIAAPTAGLHFSDDLLAAVRAAGVGLELVTLHVGPGTFKPVTAQRVTDHRMHPEWGEVPDSVAAAINATRQAGGRIVAVGTTTTRLLESAARDGSVHPFRGETDCFIVPGYRFRAIDALITNFHLPRSTLIMMVSAFAGRDLTLRAYREAAEREYRFYSFGDAMLVL